MNVHIQAANESENLFSSIRKSVGISTQAHTDRYTRRRDPFPPRSIQSQSAQCYPSPLPFIFPLENLSTSIQTALHNLKLVKNIRCVLLIAHVAGGLQVVGGGGVVFLDAALGVATEGVAA